MRNMLAMCGDKASIRLTYSAASSPDHLILGFKSKLSYAHLRLRLADVTIEPLIVPHIDYGQRLLTTACQQTAFSKLRSYESQCRVWLVTAYTASMDSGELRKLLMQHNDNRPEGGNVGLKVDGGRLSFDWGATPASRRDKVGALHELSVTVGYTTYKHDADSRDRVKQQEQQEKRAEVDGSASESSEEEQWDNEWESDEDDSRARNDKSAARRERMARQSFHRTRVTVSEQRSKQPATPLHAAFSLRYLAALTKHPMSSRVYLHLTHDMPLCLMYVLRHNNLLVGRFSCYVAPRVDE